MLQQDGDMNCVFENETAARGLWQDLRMPYGVRGWTLLGEAFIVRELRGYLSKRSHACQNRIVRKLMRTGFWETLNPIHSPPQNVISRLKLSSH